MVDFIGYLAGFLAMISFLPQVIKTIRTRSVDDISISMLMLTLVTNILYLIYGIALNLTPVVVMLTIMTVIVIVQIIFTMRLKKTVKVPNQTSPVDTTE